MGYSLHIVLASLAEYELQGTRAFLGVGSVMRLLGSRAQAQYLWHMGLIVGLAFTGKRVS